MLVAVQDICYVFALRGKIDHEWERCNDSQHIEVSPSVAGGIPVYDGKQSIGPFLSQRLRFCTAVVGDLQAKKINEFVGGYHPATY